MRNDPLNMASFVPSRTHFEIYPDLYVECAEGSKEMITVKATREGLEGEKTALGWPISDLVSFVALPSRKALNRHVRLLNPINGLMSIAEVLDVGPWNESDDAYVFQQATRPGGFALNNDPIRPQAERGQDQFGRPTNGAGIDLGQKAWFALGLSDNAEIEWEFIE